MAANLSEAAVAVLGTGDAGGKARASFLIDKDSVVRNIWRKVMVIGHVEAVLKVANAL